MPEIEKENTWQNWQVRCTFDDKKFFQEVSAKFNMPVSQVLRLAFENLLLNDETNSESKKVIQEVDLLTTRLNQLIKAQLYIAFEAQQQSKSELLKLLEEKESLNQFSEVLKNSLEQEYEQKTKEFESQCNETFHHNLSELNAQLSQKEKENFTLLENIEKLNADNGTQSQQLSLMQKELIDKNKLLNTYEEREFDLKKKVFELEEKVKSQNIDTLRIQKLEVENAVLQERIEALKNEDKLKQQFIELQLKMSEKSQKRIL